MNSTFHEAPNNTLWKEQRLKLIIISCEEHNLETSNNPVNSTMFEAPKNILWKAQLINLLIIFCEQHNSWSS